MLCNTCNDGGFQNNQLIVAEYSDYFAGTMINSYDKRSVLGGYSHHIGYGFGVDLGMATGYEDESLSYKGVMPVVAPYYRYRAVRVNVFGDALSVAVALTF